MKKLVTSIFVVSLIVIVLLGLLFSDDLKGLWNKITGKATSNSAISNIKGKTTTKLDYVPGEVIVKFKDDADVSINKDSIKRLNKKNKITKVDKIFKESKKTDKEKNKELKKVVKLKTTLEDDLWSVIDDYQQSPDVEYAEPNYIYTTKFVPNDPYYYSQWAHKTTNAELAWDTEKGKQDIIIAIIDTGVDYTHEDLSNNMVGDCTNGCPDGTGYDFVDINTASYVKSGGEIIPEEDYIIPDNNPSDYDGHGTSSAGIAAGIGNNNIGISGVCPNCRIMPVRVGFAIKYGGEIWSSLEGENIAQAIVYATDNGAMIISMSFGGGNSKIVKSAIDYAYSKGVVLVAAAGNEGTSNPSYSYPAAYDNVIAVTAIDSSNRKPSYSNYGYWVDVAAPGDNVLSIVPKSGANSNFNGYNSFFGTSAATPYVAGLAGLILSHTPQLSNQEVMNIIKTSVSPKPDIGLYIGSGIVDASIAIQNTGASIAKLTGTDTEKEYYSGGIKEYYSGNINIMGTASGKGFNHYKLEYGEGFYPEKWNLLTEKFSQVINGEIFKWDTTKQYDGEYTLKLSVYDNGGHFVSGYTFYYIINKFNGECNSCFDCTYKMNNLKLKPRNFFLGRTISTPHDRCIIIQKKKISLDCKNNNILTTGLMTGSGCGIASYYNLNPTISNCIISGFNSQVCT